MSDTRLAEELGRMTLFQNLSTAALARLAEGARRVAKAVANGVSLQPDFRHAANLQRVLDHAMNVDGPLPKIM